MKKTRNTAFIVELMLLFILLLAVIVVITLTLMASRRQSLYARHLTEAVCLAEDVAEVSMAAPDDASAEELLRGMEQVKSAEKTDSGLELNMDFTADDGRTDTYRVLLTQEAEGASPGAAGEGSGTYIAGEIRVYFGTDAEPIYTLQTGSYRAG